MNFKNLMEPHEPTPVVPAKAACPTAGRAAESRVARHPPTGGGGRSGINQFISTFFVLIIILVLAFFQVPSAFACDCAPASVEVVLSKADAVFAGRVSQLQYLDDPKQKSPEPRVIVTFDVSQWWKGSNDKQAVLHTVYNTFTCNGYWFKENEEYLVYAFKQQDGTLGTSFCKRTKLLAQANEDLITLGKVKLPVEGVSSTEPIFLKNNFTTEIVVGVITLVVIGVVYKFIISKKEIKH